MTERKPPDLSFTSWIDRQINEAAERGAFDNLPGAGKPLPKRTGADAAEAWLRDYLRREGMSADEAPAHPAQAAQGDRTPGRDGPGSGQRAGGPRRRRGHQPAHHRMAPDPDRPARIASAPERGKLGRPMARRASGSATAGAAVPGTRASPTDSTVASPSQLTVTARGVTWWACALWVRDDLGEKWPVSRSVDLWNRCLTLAGFEELAPAVGLSLLIRQSCGGAG